VRPLLQNDARSKDVEVKKREQEFLTLQHMKEWCVSTTTVRGLSARADHATICSGTSKCATSKPR
jgi:hypothetical protein